MRIYKSVLGLFVFSLLVISAGCGSSINLTAGNPPPPVTGAYTNASLNGSYVFLIRGTNVGFYSIAGTFQANGAGVITAGTEDINSPGTGILMNNVAITGTYTVLADGRATAALNSTAGNFAIDFVLLSNTHGLAIRFNNSATADGTIDAQDVSAFSAAVLQGSFAFSMFGGDHNGNFEVTAGAFTTANINNSDAIQIGVEDINDNGTLSVNRVLTGAFTNPTTGRGTATLTTNVAALNFAYYVVDASHIVLIETDIQPVLAGNAYRQNAAVVSGTMVLAMSGSSGNLAFAAGAILNADANGNILSTSSEDANKGGTVTQNIAVSGIYSSIVGGRGTINLPGSSGMIALAVYPSSGGFLVVSIDSSTVAIGTAFIQQIATPSISSLNGRFGLSLGGANTAGTVDAIAQFTADGHGNITGHLDENSAGSLGSGMGLTGTYTLASTGRGTAVLNSDAGTMNLIFYMLDASNFAYIEADTGQVAIGKISTQQ